MHEPALPEGYRARPPSRADASQVAAMIATCELDVFGNTEMTEALLLDDWSDLDSDSDAIIVLAPAGSVAAAAYLFNHADTAIAVYDYVHPSRRGQGLSTFLVQWAQQQAYEHLRRAPAAAALVVRHFPAQQDADAQQRLAAQGYAPERGFSVMALHLDAAPAPPAWPDGISVRTFKPGQDERAAFETLKAAFEDHWSALITAASFREMTEAASFDPALWHLAWDGDEPVGICFGKLIDGSGWIDDLGVRPAWRHRGLGLALLQQAFGALYARGATNVGLSVDAESLTGAPRLFERAGMQVKRSYILYQRELRSGTVEKVK